MAEGEDQKDRVNRELGELLNELRVALPGIQILFAFLLILPFSNGFSRTSGLDRAVYLVTFLCAAAASTLLIAPSSYHRLRFREPDKERMVFTSNRLAIAGTAFLAVAIAGVVFVITDVLVDTLWASLITAAVAGWTAWFWFGLPLSRRLQDDEGSSARPAASGSPESGSTEASETGSGSTGAAGR